jgi:hypothetical protein
MRNTREVITVLRIATTSVSPIEHHIRPSPHPFGVTWSALALFVICTSHRLTVRYANDV